MKKSQLLALLVVVVVIGGIVLLIKGAKNKEAPSNVKIEKVQPSEREINAPSTNTPQTNTEETKPQTTNPVTLPKRAVTSPSQKATGVEVLSPRDSDAWIIDSQNIIAWSREMGIAGSIALIDAKTEKVAGWIAQNVGARQSSFQWDTRDVFLSYYESLKKPVEAGSYKVRIFFEGGKGDAESKTFMIGKEGELKNRINIVTYSNLVFTPGGVTVPQGDRVIFKNNHTVSQVFSSRTTSHSYNLRPGESALLDTKDLPPGLYEFYAAGSPLSKVTILVK